MSSSLGSGTKADEIVDNYASKGLPLNGANNWQDQQKYHQEGEEYDEYDNQGINIQDQPRSARTLRLREEQDSDTIQDNRNIEQLQHSNSAIELRRDNIIKGNQNHKQDQYYQQSGYNQINDKQNSIAERLKELRRDIQSNSMNHNDTDIGNRSNNNTQAIGLERQGQIYGSDNNDINSNDIKSGMQMSFRQKISVIEQQQSQQQQQQQQKHNQFEQMMDSEQQSVDNLNATCESSQEQFSNQIGKNINNISSHNGQTNQQGQQYQRRGFVQLALKGILERSNEHNITNNSSSTNTNININTTNNNNNNHRSHSAANSREQQTININNNINKLGNINSSYNQSSSFGGQQDYNRNNNNNTNTRMNQMFLSQDSVMPAMQNMKSNDQNVQEDHRDEDGNNTAELIRSNSLNNSIKSQQQQYNQSSAVFASPSFSNHSNHNNNNNNNNNYDTFKTGTFNEHNTINSNSNRFGNTNLINNYQFNPIHTSNFNGLKDQNNNNNNQNQMPQGTESQDGSNSRKENIFISSTSQSKDVLSKSLRSNNNNRLDNENNTNQIHSDINKRTQGIEYDQFIGSSLTNKYNNINNSKNGQETFRYEESSSIIKRNIQNNSNSKSYASAIRALQEKIRQLQAELNQSRMSMDDLKAELTQTSEQYSQEIATKVQESISQAAKIESLENDLHTSQQECLELQTLFNAADQDKSALFDRMENEIQQLKAELSLNNQTLQLEKAAKMKVVQQISRLEELNEEYKRKLRQSEADLEDCLISSKDLQSRLAVELAAKESAINKMERVQREQEKQRGHYNEQLRGFQGELQVLESSYIGKISELEKKCSELVDEQVNDKQKLKMVEDDRIRIEKRERQLQQDYEDDKKKWMKQQRKMKEQIEKLLQEQWKGQEDQKDDRIRRNRSISPLSDGRDQGRSGSNSSNSKQQNKRLDQNNYNQESDIKRIDGLDKNSKIKTTTTNTTSRSRSPSVEGNNQKKKEKDSGLQGQKDKNKDSRLSQQEMYEQKEELGQQQQQVSQEQFDTPLFHNEIIKDAQGTTKGQGQGLKMQQLMTYQQQQGEGIDDGLAESNTSQRINRSHVQSLSQQQQYVENNNNINYRQSLNVSSINVSQVNASPLNRSSNSNAYSQYIENNNNNQSSIINNLNSQMHNNNNNNISLDSSEKYEYVLKQIIEAEKNALALSSQFQQLLAESSKAEDSKKKHELRGRLIEINDQINKNNQKLFGLKRKEQECLDSIS